MNPNKQWLMLMVSAVYGLPGATDIWKPVDAGYHELLNVKVRQAHYRWLD